jgi:Zn-dependent protease
MPIVALSSIFSRFGSGFNLQDFLITILVLSISLSFHEFAHGYMANRMGDDTAALAGRLTMNPLAHLDPIGSLVFIFAGIGWAKPVPINPARFTHARTMKRGIVLTSLAGPSANFILSIISALLFYIVTTFFLLANATSGFLYILLSGLLQRLYFTNMVLMIFNLLPIPPLDGYKVFGALLPNQLYYKVMSYERYIGMIFLFLVFFGGNVIGTILSTIMIPFDYVIGQPLSLLFKALWQLMGIAG